MKEYKLLIIDDSTTMYKIISKKLNANGIINIDYAPDGNSGVKIAKVKDYDLITVDISMPGINGFTTVEEILKTKPDQKFLFISSQSSMDNRNKAKTLGVSEFLPKPFNPDDLLKKVFMLLNPDLLNNAV